MPRVIHEQPPEFPHRFTTVKKHDVWTTGGATRSNNTTYGHCGDCGKQYLSPHDLYTECREHKRKALTERAQKA